MSSCNICGEPLTEGNRRVRGPTEMTLLVQRGFGPWCRFEHNVTRALSPSMACPVFVRAMFMDKAREHRADWALCVPCFDAAEWIDREASQEPPGYVAPRDWLRGILTEVERSGPKPLPMPRLDASDQVKGLARRLEKDLSATPAGKGGSLAGGFAIHGERYGYAAALILLTTPLRRTSLGTLFGAAELLAEWSDPRAVAFLNAGLKREFLVSWIAPLLTKRGDKRSLLPALQSLAHFLNVQDRYRDCWLPPGAHVPYPSFFSPTKEVVSHIESLVPPIPPEDLSSLYETGAAICWLMREVAALGDKWGLQTVREIFAFSQFQSDIVESAQEIRVFDDPADQDAVALVVANQALGGAFGEKAFLAQLDYLERHSSAAGWWAMDRFCNTAKDWRQRQQIPGVRQALTRLREPSEDERRRLDLYYGPFLDLMQEAREKQSAGASKCFVASAAWETDQADDVIRLRAFRDNVLLRTRWGSSFVAVYEAVSPPLACWIQRSKSRRKLARTLIVRPARRIADLFQTVQ